MGMGREARWRAEHIPHLTRTAWQWRGTFVESTPRRSCRPPARDWTDLLAIGRTRDSPLPRCHTAAAASGPTPRHGTAPGTWRTALRRRGARSAATAMPRRARPSERGHTHTRTRNAHAHRHTLARAYSLRRGMTSYLSEVSRRSGGHRALPSPCWLLHPQTRMNIHMLTTSTPHWVTRKGG